jgi:hypothetical protein
MVGGLMAMLMRAELAQPGLQFLSNEQYNQLFTMHGTIMLLLYATPILFGFANYIVPLQIGSPDVAFPRLNAFSFWAFLFGGLTVMSGFLTPGGAADFGWFAYTPLSDAIHSPGYGADLWIVGLAPPAMLGDAFAEAGYDNELLLVDETAVNIEFPDPRGFDVIIPLGATLSAYEPALLRAWRRNGHAARGRSRRGAGSRRVLRRAATGAGTRRQSQSLGSA